MKRQFPQQTLGVTLPQPVFGTTLGAATFPSAEPVSILVASSAIFEIGDRVKVGAGSATPEMAEIVQIADGTHITIATAKAHANGAFVQLSYPLSSFYLQTLDGATGHYYVGKGSAVDSTHYIAKLVKVAADVQPVEFSDAQIYGGNPGSSEEWWINGTAGDKYAASLSYV